MLKFWIVSWLCKDVWQFFECGMLVCDSYVIDSFAFAGLVIGPTVPKLWKKNGHRGQKLLTNFKDWSSESYEL